MAPVVLGIGVALGSMGSIVGGVVALVVRRRGAKNQEAAKETTLSRGSTFLHSGQLVALQLDGKLVHATHQARSCIISLSEVAFAGEEEG